VTRIVFSSQDLKARSWLKQVLSDWGLRVREDAIGNTFARWEGSEANAAPVATGSHIDAIPDSGRFDGTIGVLGALEAIRSLRRAGFQPRRPIELIVFTAEEPTRFGIGCLGSRLLSGTLSPARAALLRDPNGLMLDDVRCAAGFEGSLERVPLRVGTYHAFVELHIEQGPLLERQAVPIGIVTSIAAPASLRVNIKGEGGHAGAVLMPDRRDALLGAAEIVLAVEAAALGTGAPDSVATTGICQVHPGAVNSIPNEVSLQIDVRDTDLVRRDAMVKSITDACSDVATSRHLEVSADIVNADAPSQCHPMVVEAATRACEASGLQAMPLVSRAYHDSLFLSRLGPTGMIFIPCKGGISHRPDEYASPEDIAAGISVLAHTLATLAS
jgi:N-carbamoyl-L-amino-acid hydrolase